MGAKILNCQVNRMLNQGGLEDRVEGRNAESRLLIYAMNLDIDVTIVALNIF